MFSIFFGLACVAGLIHLNRGYLPGRRGRCHQDGHHEHRGHHRGLSDCTTAAATTATTATT